MCSSDLAGGIYWYKSLDKKSFDNTRWLSRSFDGTRSIHVQAAKGTYMLKALKDGWEALVPGTSWNISARVLPDRVSGYLAQLADLTPYRSIGGFDQGGPEEYGLDAPELKIIVNFEGETNKSLTLKLTSDEAGTVYGWSSDNPGLVYEFDKKTMGQLGLPATH